MLKRLIPKRNISNPSTFTPKPNNSWIYILYGTVGVGTGYGIYKYLKTDKDKRSLKNVKEEIKQDIKEIID
jgi:hypothetical protein